MATTVAAKGIVTAIGSLCQMGADIVALIAQLAQRWRPANL
eukprot:SAG22_NODE_14427_length_375_cov_0.608696_1_plen_41_part_10